MITFPIQELLDEQKCYDYLLKLLHPAGLKCPAGHPLRPGPQYSTIAVPSAVASSMPSPIRYGVAGVTLVFLWS